MYVYITVYRKRAQFAAKRKRFCVIYKSRLHRACALQNGFSVLFSIYTLCAEIYEDMPMNEIEILVALRNRSCTEGMSERCHHGCHEARRRVALV